MLRTAKWGSSLGLVTIRSHLPVLLELLSLPTIPALVQRLSIGLPGNVVMGANVTLFDVVEYLEGTGL